MFDKGRVWVKYVRVHEREGEGMEEQRRMEDRMERDALK